MAQLVYDETGVDRVVLSAKTHMANLASMEGHMFEAAALVYEATRQWMDSNGEGTWPPLAEATVTRKASQGLAEPERPLYAYGNLFESATSPHGPYSYLIPMHDGIVMGIVWTPAKALAVGTSHSGGGGRTSIPARPIFPPPYSMLGLELQHAIGELILKGHTTRLGGSVGPGAKMARIGKGLPGAGRYAPLRQTIAPTRHLPSMITSQMRRP